VKPGAVFAGALLVALGAGALAALLHEGERLAPLLVPRARSHRQLAAPVHAGWAAPTATPPSAQERDSEASAGRESRAQQPPTTEAAPESEPFAWVRGSILDDRGGPVYGAELQLTAADGEVRVVSPGELEFDAEGEFRFELEPGHYTAVARAPEHTPAPPVSFAVEAAGAVIPPLTLARQGILRGSIALPAEWQARLPQTFEVVLEVADDAPMSLETLDDEPQVVVRRESLWVGPDLNFELRDCDHGLYRLRLELPQAGGTRASAWTQTWLDPADVREGLRLSFLEEREPSLAGRVTDADGLPLGGVNVELGPHRVTTDSAGRFELRGLDLGPHALIASKDGYAATEVEVEFAGELLRHDLTLHLGIEFR